MITNTISSVHRSPEASSASLSIAGPEAPTVEPDTAPPDTEPTTEPDTEPAEPDVEPEPDEDQPQLDPPPLEEPSECPQRKGDDGDWETCSLPAGFSL